MIIGKLDRKLKLYTQTYSTNAYGERVVLDNSYVTIYGDFDFKSGNTTYDADDLINSQTIECLIRYRTKIGTTPQYFIQNGSTNYSIKAIRQVGNRKDAMILTLEKNDVVDLSTVAPNQFVFTIDTANLSDGSTLNTQFKLPTVASGSYNCTVLWGDGSSSTITSYNQEEITHTYSSAGEYQISIEGTIQGWQFNNTQDRLKILNISNWGTLDISTNKAFFGCSNLEANATDYPTISAESLESMFEGCTNFDGVVDEWNVAGVYSFDKMFKDCYSFDQPLNSWNTENSGSYISLFENCITFNQDLSNWQVEAVIDMSRMFYNCVQFNGEISSWSLSDTEIMSEMLFNCDRFDQSLAGWNINNVTDFTNFMQNASGLSNANYDATLIAWASGRVESDININFGGSQYTFSAFYSKQSLIEDDNWTIVDGGIFDPTPAQYISVLNTRVVAAGGVVENTTDSQAFFTRTKRHKLMASGLLDKANIILTPTGYKAGTMYNVAPIEQPYEDFDFARASVASRVNSSGLVEMVGRTLGSNLVQNGDFSEIGPDLVQNGDFSELGSELIDNSDWSVNSPVTNDNGLLTFSGVSGTYASQDILTSGKSYKVTFDVLASSGDLTIFAGAANQVYDESPTSNSTVTIYVTSGGVNNRIYFGNFFTGQIQNVSVKEVPDWTVTDSDTNNYVEFLDGFARLKFLNTSPITMLNSSLTLQANKNYKLIVDVHDVTSGAIKIDSGGISELFNTEGVTTRYLNPTGNTTLSFYRATADVDITLASVSVQELDPNDYWNLETGWSLGDNQAIKTGSVASNFYQYSVFTTGQTYKLSFTISNSNDGRLLVYVGGNSVTEDITNASNGTYTFYANSDNVNLVFRNVTFEGSITNVTAQEVIDTNNIPRINYDSNGENGHWLLEPTSTNEITYSEDLSQWTSNDVTVTDNIAISPDGTQNASKIELDSGTSIKRISLGSMPTSSVNRSFSVFIKANSDFTGAVQLVHSGDLQGFANFDLSDGTVGSTGSKTTANIVSYANDWYRCTAIFDSTNTFASTVYLWVQDNDSGSYGGSTSATGSIFAYGFQYEALSYATSYIPTLTGSTETRATETANGAGSADLINSTEGVLYAEIAALANDGTFRVISINSGDNTNIVKLGYRTTSNAIYYEVRSGNVSQSFEIYTTTDVKEFHKVALLYKENDFKLFVDGVNVLSDTSGSTPIGLNNLSFEANSGAYFYGKVKALAVYNTALTDAELIELTS